MKQVPVAKEFISKAPSPSRGEGCNISLSLGGGSPIFFPPPLRGGDEGEGVVCGFTNDRISMYMGVPLNGK